MAAAAWKVLTHLMPAMTGHSDSPAAACRAVAARMPGVTNSRYSTPATVPWFSSTRPPRPTPMAPRNSTGISTPVRSDVFHRCRQTRASRSATSSIGTAWTSPDGSARAPGPAASGSAATAASLIERAAGEEQEHVFERAAAHEHRLGVHAALGHRGHGVVAAVGVDRARGRPPPRCGRRGRRAAGRRRPAARARRSAARRPRASSGGRSAGGASPRRRCAPRP